MATLTAREKFLKLVADNGWAPNPDRKKTERRFNHTSREYDTTEIQDPHAFIKPAAHGGTWEIDLDYSVKGYGYSSRKTIGSTLRGVTINYRLPSGELQARNDKMEDRYARANIGILAPSSNYRTRDTLLDLLNIPADDYTSPDLPFPKRAEKLIKNIDLAVWLYIEKCHENNVARREAARKEEALRRAKARPLPITVAQYVDHEYGRSSYDAPWAKLTDKLERAAKYIAKADGTDDLAALVADAHKALAAITDALTDEASLEVGEIIAAEVLAS